MELFIVLLLIALLFGFGGLVTAAKWLLIIAIIFFVLGLFSYSGRP